MLSMARFRIVLGRGVMAAGIDGGPAHFPVHGSTERVDFRDGLDFVAEKLDADGAVGFVGREDIDDIPAHPEGSPVEIDVIPAVLHRHETLDKALAGICGARFEFHAQLVVGFGRADSVDA